MPDRKEPTLTEMQRMVQQAEIKRKLEVVLDLEKKKRERLNYLMQVVSLGEGVMQCHDLNRIRMKAEGAPKDALVLVDSVSAPFRQHLEQTKEALRLVREVLVQTEKPDPPDLVA